MARKKACVCASGAIPLCRFVSTITPPSSSSSSSPSPASAAAAFKSIVYSTRGDVLPPAPGGSPGIVVVVAVAVAVVVVVAIDGLIPLPTDVESRQVFSIRSGLRSSPCS